MTTGESGSRLENLPVEIRDDDFALIARATVGTVADKLADSPVETCYLSVTLPDGATVGRAMQGGVAAPHDTAEVEALLADLPSVSAFLVAEQTPEPPREEVMLQDGISYARLLDTGARGAITATLFAGTGAAAYGPTPLKGGGAYGLAVTRAAHAVPATAQLSLRQSARVNLPLPHGATVEFRPDGNGWYGTTVLTGVPGIDDLIRLRAAGRIEDVASILHGFGPADAVAWFDSHPAAAAVLGYGLLRTDEPETLADSFDRIAQDWPDDPDALVIAAEIAARVGDHGKAASGFLAAARVGLPTFSFGIGYLVDRLRAYGPSPGGPTFEPDMAKAIAAAFDRVHGFAVHQDYTTMLTGYGGADPTAPAAIVR